MYYIAFARYDAFSDDPEYGSCSDSGRETYITDSREDAEAELSRWSNGSRNTDTSWYSVRRGCVDGPFDRYDEELLSYISASDEFGGRTDELCDVAWGLASEMQKSWKYCPALPPRTSVLA